MNEHYDTHRNRRADLLGYLEEADVENARAWAFIDSMMGDFSTDQYGALSSHLNAAGGAAKAAKGMVNELLLELDSYASALRAADGVITELLRQLYPDVPIEPGSAIGLAQGQIRAALSTHWKPPREE